VENPHRIRQAIQGIKQMFKDKSPRPKAKKKAAKKRK